MRAADVADLLKNIATDVRKFVAEALGTFEERVLSIENRLQAQPAPVTADAVGALVDAVGARLDGIGERLAIVEDHTPVAGERGERGDAGPRGESGAAGERGADGAPGKDIDQEVLQAAIDAAVARAVATAMAAIPAPKDGADGQQGADGRDALQIDVLDMIDPAKCYPRGTFATWNGGIVRSFRATEPLAEGERIEKSGWALVVDGIAEVISESSDDPRKFALHVLTTSGKTLDLPFSMPTPIWRGVWAEREFERGDLVTYDGSLWHCERSTTAKPGTQVSAPDWKLCTKKGRDGRDGEKGPKGEPGQDGRPGRDLTQLGLDGSKT